MASYVGETTTNVENTDVLMNSKNMNAEKSKTALIDVKNANALSSGERKSPLKKIQVEIEKEDEGKEFASSKDVDYHDVWVEKIALTDEEITRWINMLNIARDMNPYDETEPPKPPSMFDYEEFTQIKNDDEFPKILIPPSLPSSPIFNSTGYFSMDNSIADEENHFPSGNYDDTETSDLDQSIFELELNSDDD